MLSLRLSLLVVSLLLFILGTRSAVSASESAGTPDPRRAARKLRATAGNTGELQSPSATTAAASSGRVAWGGAWSAPSTSSAARMAVVNACPGL